MALRYVLFSTDPSTVEPICQALTNLGVEGEHCPDAVAAVEKVCRESFQILIVDWDQQPEAGALLAAARERKVKERPLTLAIVSQDAAVPKALQAGATSILRKPIELKQVTDSLSRARELLKARESAQQAAAASAATGGTSSAPTGSPVSFPAIAPAIQSTNDATLRAGEFLQSPAPSSQLDTESEMQKSMEQSAAQEVDALKDLEPMASAVVKEKPPETPVAPAPDGPRGLQWYLNRAGKSAPTAAPAPVPAEAEPAAPPASRSHSANPELLGFDQAPSFLGKAETHSGESASPPDATQEKKAAELFAYIAGENEEPEKKKESGPRIRLGKGAILFALALAGCAIAAAPQAPWHPQMQKLWSREQKSLHAWLNPQPVTPAQAPASHENFGRAGDEYKLPVAENIPDATTDPSQIKVTPMVDPTAKKPNNSANADPNLAPADTNPADTVQNPSAQTPTDQVPNSTAPGNAAPSDSNSSNPASNNSAAGNQVQVGPAANANQPNNPTQPAAQTASGQPVNGTPSGSASPALPPSSAAPSVPNNSQLRPAPAASAPPIPSSLKSQMASMTPEASGNKAPETALPSIEPVSVPEATERGLVTDQPAPGYPDSAKGQQGAVVLQVLIGRDGTVQDAKFLQGSLAFARAAIDGVKQWKFKPYMMNGRPVSVQTNLTISFRPGQ